MKKTLLMGLFFFIILFGAAVASANRWDSGFGIYVPPPVIVTPPPMVYPYSFPPPYYGPRPYYPQYSPPYVVH